MDEFKQAIELGPARLTEAPAILKTARSTQLTPRIEEELSEFRQNEFALLEGRQQDTNRSEVLSTFFAVALSISALVSAAIGIFDLYQTNSGAFVAMILQPNDEGTILIQPCSTGEAGPPGAG